MEHKKGKAMRFDGKTFDINRDGKRLGNQLLAVKRLLSDGKACTLREISRKTGHPEASVSARIRDLRKEQYGGFDVLAVNHNNSGTWLYSLRGVSK